MRSKYEAVDFGGIEAYRKIHSVDWETVIGVVAAFLVVAAVGIVMFSELLIVPNL